MTLKYACALFFHSDFPFTTFRKKQHSFVFFKTVFGTFCATCTVTGYPCLVFVFVWIYWWLKSMFILVLHWVWSVFAFVDIIWQWCTSAVSTCPGWPKMLIQKCFPYNSHKWEIFFHPIPFHPYVQKFVWNLYNKHFPIYKVCIIGVFSINQKVVFCFQIIFWKTLGCVCNRTQMTKTLVSQSTKGWTVLHLRKIPIFFELSFTNDITK